MSAGTDGQIILWDAMSGQALHTQHFPEKTLGAAFAPDGRFVGTGTARATCYVMELRPHLR